MPARGTPMTQQAASRVQSSTCKSTGGTTPAGSFAARAQSSAATNANNSASSGAAPRK